MKTKLFLAALAATAALQFSPTVSAQTSERQERWQHRGHGRFLASLTADERAKFKAAHKQAMADPAVQAAKNRRQQAAKDFRDLKRAAMLRADPSIQPILDKIPARGERDS